VPDSTARSKAIPTGDDPTPPEAHIPLDEVMLAMDVVDTLRHQRALVEAELGEEQRRDKLIARIKSIYESQGMEVSEEVIAEGVRALEEDRFTYEAPERGFQVRLAEVYVERGKWTKRALVVVLVALVLWLAFAIPAHMHRRSLVEGFERQVADLQEQTQELSRQASRLQERIEAAGRKLASAGTSVPAAPEILAGARRSLGAANKDLQKLTTDLEPGPDPQTYPDEQSRLDGWLAGHRKLLVGVQADISSATGQLSSLDHLHSLRAELNRVFARLRGLEVAPAVMSDLTRQQAAANSALEAGKIEEAKRDLRRLTGQVDDIVRAHHQRAAREAELSRLQRRLEDMEPDRDSKVEAEGLLAAVRTAIQGNDDNAATRELAELTLLVTELDRSYELRIVSGGNKRSGVWRKKNDDPRVRNYYIIVEAIDRNGHRLVLPVRNEETGRTSKVTSFGIRVAESVYEKVKNDKLDNGIIDNRVFGRKKRGTRRVEYFFPVQGGRITSW